jgi:Reverse transcriptase (RNA-dependent DNA polymerase)
VIAPKATAPYIRFCGDYRIINDFIDIPQQPIPIVKHELVKAAGFKYFVDLDMANSFHQIPLSEEFSNLLSVQTPWGLYRPKFLPEGVGPASGLLQHIVRELFEDFKDWTIVIFDNFLVLADSYMDAYDKLQRVVLRCCDKGLVLKLKKSWFGVQSVTFFGYEVTDGKWRLSQSRKDGIQAMSMPRNTKQMQSFLGAALFFHHHIPSYTDWAAKLYDTTKAGFDWQDKSTWKEDYEQLFEDFKQAIGAATELYFPDYPCPGSFAQMRRLLESRVLSSK